MSRPPMTRADYAKLSIEECERRLTAALDRMQRADTNEDILADLFAEQELRAALADSGLQYTADGKPIGPGWPK